MKLSNDQISNIKEILKKRGVYSYVLDSANSFNELDYLWTAQFGYRNTLVKHLKDS